MSESYKRNLAVPFFTQRDNTYVWQQKLESANGFYSIGISLLDVTQKIKKEITLGRIYLWKKEN